MGERERFKNPMRMKETTEQGDIAKAMQGMIDTQYNSKDLYDMIASTNWSKREAIYYMIMNVQRMMDRAYTMEESDVSNERLADLSDSEKMVRKELWRRRKKFMENPVAISEQTWESFMYMMPLAYKSIDGMSLNYGVNIAGRGTKLITDGSNLNAFQKIKKRMFDNVIYYDE